MTADRYAKYRREGYDYARRRFYRTLMRLSVDEKETQRARLRFQQLAEYVGWALSDYDGNPVPEGER